MNYVEMNQTRLLLLMNLAYSGNKGLTKTTISDKILKDRAYEFARNCQ